MYIFYRACGCFLYAPSIYPHLFKRLTERGFNDVGHLYSEGCEANLTEFLEVPYSINSYKEFLCRMQLSQRN